MKRYLAACIGSAILGAAAFALLERSGGLPAISAQELQPGIAPSGRPLRFPSRTPPVARPGEDDDLTAEERVNVLVYEAVNRSVVNIETKRLDRDGFFLFDVPSAGAGSGSVIDKQGHILTNYHVIDEAQEIEVTLFNGKPSYPARLVGRDELTDVAVLEIDAPAELLFPVVLGDSTRLKVGQRAYAIGNPFGLERTLTTGVISSLNRSLPGRHHRKMSSMIQLDAAINPGNSGGPLLDSRGRLIGMNTAIATSTGQSAGVGFAIPVANIARVVPQLIQRGRVIRPDTGITRVMQTEQGLLIATMAAGSPAEQAGLRGFRVVRQRKRQGPFSYETNTVDRSGADLIVAVDGQPITTADDFLTVIESKQPGEDAIITIVRAGRELAVPLRLAAGES